MSFLVFSGQESEPVPLVVDPEKPTVVSALARHRPSSSFFVLLRDHCGQGGEAAKAEGCQDQEWVLVKENFGELLPQLTNTGKPQV